MALLFVCCDLNNEPGLNIQMPSKSEITLKGDALRFDSIKAFQETMNYLNSLPIEKLEEYENQLGFANSLRSRLMVSDSEEISDEVLKINVKDFRLATVVNSKGIYYIGNVIHKITDSFEFAMENGNEETLLNAERDDLKVDGLVKHKITGFTSAIPKENGRFSGKESIIIPIANDPSGNSKRVTMEAWSRNYLTYASNGVNLITESFRRTCGLCSRKWRDSAVQYMKVNSVSRHYPSVGGSGLWLILNNQEEAYSYHNIQKVIDYVAGFGVWIDTDYIDYTTIDDANVRRDNFVHWVN